MGMEEAMYWRRTALVLQYVSELAHYSPLQARRASEECNVLHRAVADDNNNIHTNHRYQCRVLSITNNTAASYRGGIVPSLTNWAQRHHGVWP
jgi:hypothetical protein